ncbi:MAG TPA: type II toxin-antitoxin system PrlF family antitoxin [Gemmatimonadaceae bacterium]|jgi:Regulators of stationary/sporulation gene expression
MPSIVTSKLTERSQTTLPPAVRTVLGLGPGQRIGYVIAGNEVRIINASAMEHDDPVLDEFLAFLGRDMAEHPDRIAAFPASLLARARSAAEGAVIDHGAPLDGAVEL